MDIALGMILGQEDPTLIREWFAHHGKFFGRVYLCVDAKPDAQPSEAEKAAKSMRCRDLVLFRRVLDGDFAAQRNAVARRVAEDWLLMLDVDERLDEGAMRALPHVLACVTRTRPGVRVLGFARCNKIDGRDTGVWPDWQFRLARRGVRWRNTAPNLDASPGCHEFPTEVHDAPEAVALLQEIVIIHSKDSARQRRQDELYALLETGGAEGDG